MRGWRMRVVAVRRSIVLLWALTVGLFVALVATAAVAGQHPEIGGGGTTESVVLFGLIGLWGLSNATVGAIILWRRPGNRIGRILLAAGPLLISVFLGFLVSAIRRLTDGSGDLLAALAGWWASLSILPAMFGAFPRFVILFADGRLPGPRWTSPLA